MKNQLPGMESRNTAGGSAAGGRGVDCVFLSCFEHEVLFFASLLAQDGIRVHRADTVQAADFLLLATGGTTLIVDTTFLDGSWDDALEMIASVHPLVATLIRADPVDRELLARARDRGAFDVLWQPIELDRLRSGIRMAHEVTAERRLWSAVGACLEPAK